MAERETIVLVHGLWEIPLNLRFLGFYLKKSGFNVKYFKYRSVFCDISENTQSLFQFLKSINCKRIHLAGHSLGGLIVLELLEKYSVANIGQSVIFGSPVNGSVVVREMGKNNIGKKIYGRSFDTLCNGLSLLCEHNVGVIAGIGGKGLGQFFADLPKPHDGAVSVEETQLSGASDSICLPTSHFTMLLSKKVALEISEFFKNGKFLHIDNG